MLTDEDAVPPLLIGAIIIIIIIMSFISSMFLTIRQDCWNREYWKVLSWLRWKRMAWSCKTNMTLKRIQNNKNIVLAAVAQNGLALEYYASDKWKDDIDVVLAAVAQNGWIGVRIVCFRGTERRQRCCLGRSVTSLWLCFTLRDVSDEPKGNKYLFCLVRGGKEWPFVMQCFRCMNWKTTKILSWPRVSDKEWLACS